MSRMLCKCGEILGTSATPSPYSLSVYYEKEVISALEKNPDIRLSDFLTDWDAVNETQYGFMKRSEPVEYWYCPECRRVYETQPQIGGQWLRIYQRAEFSDITMSFEGWSRIFIFTEIDTDALLEVSPQLRLSEYLHKHEGLLYLLSPDEKTLVAIADDTRNVQYIYTQEEPSMNA